MELQQEWYLHETRNAEDGKRHRPMSEENAFWHAVATGTWTLYVKTVRR